MAADQLTVAAADDCSTGSIMNNFNSSNTAVSENAAVCNSPTAGRDFTHDLPDDLLAAGWRRFWSKREHRPYFFNKITNQSLWEMPELRQESEPVASFQPPPQKRPHLLAIQQRQQQCAGAAWNLNIHSNCLMQQQFDAPSILPPHPDAELLRAQLMQQLRQQYRDLCFSKENIQPPPESFNRWLLERYTTARGTDQLFPCNCDTMISQSLFREIINDLPVRLTRPKLCSDAKKLLYSYADASKAMIESRGVSASGRKIVKFNAEQTFQFLRQCKMPNYDDCLERLAHLKRTCQPFIEEAAKESVEKICEKVAQLSEEYANQVLQFCHKLFAIDSSYLHQQQKQLQQQKQQQQQRKSRCQPAQLLPVQHQLPAVNLISTNDRLQLLSYRDQQLSISKQHYAKLYHMYTIYCRDEDPEAQKFDCRLWCMLMRYRSFLGQQGSGQCTQAALPVPVFEALARLFDVTFELFASPMNSYFKQFCSAFADTDCFFGSRGPMLDFFPNEGSFEANPPFSEELMTAMVHHIENLLKEATGPLSFIVFIPDWRDPPPDALLRLESSAFNRHQVTVLPLEHSYRSGLQHCLDKEEDLYVRSAHGTLIVFLQNDSGHSKWHPTNEKVKELLLAFSQTV